MHCGCRAKILAYSFGVNNNHKTSDTFHVQGILFQKVHSTDSGEVISSGLLLLVWRAFRAVLLFLLATEMSILLPWNSLPCIILMARCASSVLLNSTKANLKSGGWWDARLTMHVMSFEKLFYEPPWLLCFWIMNDSDTLRLWKYTLEHFTCCNERKLLH